MAGNIAKRANGKWRARSRDAAGKEHSRHFDRKIAAQQWLDQVTSAVVTGTYADPQAGRITFAAFFGEWSARQVWAPGTLLAMSLAARSVPFAGKPMKQVPALGRRDLDQADERRRACPRHDQDALRQRQVGVPRRREGQGDRLRSDRRRTPPPGPSGGRGHVDPHSGGGGAAHGRG